MHNYHELSVPQRLWYRCIERWRVPAWERFFFEGCRAIPGEMYVADRKAIFETVAAHRPGVCFEVGTRTGGGSTFFLASALAEIGSGKLLTFEIDDAQVRLARREYARHLPELMTHVEFRHGDVHSFAPALDDLGGEPFCLLLDGAEDDRQTIEQFGVFERHLRPGCVLMAHDWETLKMRALRPALEADPGWECALRLRPPASVGFVVYVYRSRRGPSVSATAAHASEPP